MGADIRIKINENINIRKLLDESSEIPIDCNIEGDEVHFHYGYWGQDHESKCENFVSKFVEDNNLEMGEWRY